MFYTTLALFFWLVLLGEVWHPAWISFAGLLGVTPLPKWNQNTLTRAGQEKGGFTNKLQIEEEEEQKLETERLQNRKR